MVASRNLTTGPIGPALLAFSMPILASNILQSLNGSINAIWISLFLGEDALAATANANLIMAVLHAAVFGFGLAAMVLIGQALGRGDVPSARRAFAASVGFCSIMSLAIAAMGIAGAGAILHMLSIPPEMFALSLDYLRVIFIAMPAMLLLVLVMTALRGAGDTMTPLWFMVLSVVLDGGLNPLFIRGFGPQPALGIAGSAWATVAASYLTLGGLIVYGYRRDLPLRLRGRVELGWLRPGRSDLRTLIGKGLPMGLQMIVFAGAGVVAIGLVNREGAMPAAAYGATLQIWAYLQLPALAIGGAVSAMTALNIGAGNWDRVARITRSGILIHLATTGISIAAIMLCATPILGLFLDPHGPAAGIARHIQWIAIWSYLPLGVTAILFGTMRANGAVIASLVTLIVTMFPLRLAIYHFTYDFLGLDALWISLDIGALCSLTAAGTLYLRGRWKLARATVGAVQTAEQALGHA